MIATHIIPQSLEAEVIEHSYGPGSSLYRSTLKNDLMSSGPVEKAFDNGKILISQTEDSPAEKPEFGIIPIDPDCLIEGRESADPTESTKKMSSAKTSTSDH